MLAILDVDGILADFYSAAKKLFGLPEWWCMPPGEHLMCKHTGMSLAEFVAPMEEDFWRNIPLMPEAREILDIVEGHFGRDNVVLWTSPSDVRGFLEGRRLWIREHLPLHYHSRTIMGSMKWIGAGPGRVLIDDFDHNVDAFREKGGQAILYPRRWNSLHQFQPQGLAILQQGAIRCTL